MNDDSRIIRLYYMGGTIGKLIALYVYLYKLQWQNSNIRWEYAQNISPDRRVLNPYVTDTYIIQLDK